MSARAGVKHTRVRGNKGTGIGPVPMPIDEKVVEAMAFGGALNIEIADYLSISVDTLTRRCNNLLVKARAHAKIKLRQRQMAAAMAGDKTMLVWLGKVVLGQKETTVTETRSLDFEKMTDAELEAIAQGRPL